MAGISFIVNGSRREVQAPGDTPLLYVLRNDLELSGPQFGCGLSQCGACTVNIKGRAVRSCVTPVGTLDGSEITTLEGLGSPEHPHPLQQAFIDEQAMQCGFCINGVIMTAKALVDRTPNPTDAQIKQAMATVLCRCAAHQRIFQAIRRYAESNPTRRTA